MICPKCQMENPENKKFCRKCGEKLPRLCPKCSASILPDNEFRRTENPETRKFCKEFGAKLSLICPDCRFQNAPGDKFCGDCGHDLIRPKESGPPKTSQVVNETRKGEEPYELTIC